MLGIGILGLVLGVTAGVLTGVAVRNMVGDDPLIEGSNATVFYVAFSLAVLVDIFLLFNFTNLSIRTSDSGIEVRYGMFGKNLRWGQISAVEVSDYRWKTYGGWGIRASTKGRRAWSQIGAKRGIIISATEGSADRSYFVSSNRAEELASLISSRIQASASELSGPGSSDSTES